VGAGIYGVTTIASGREFSWGDLGMATLVGAAGGALIGTGLGAGAGVSLMTSMVATGAGAGVLSGEIGYSIASGKDYDTGEMVIAATVGGAAGGASGAVGGSGLGGTLAGSTLDALINGAASASQYAATEVYNGRIPQLKNALIEAGTGVAVSGVFDLLGSTGGQRYSYKQARDEMEYMKYWSSVANNRAVSSSIKSSATTFVRKATTYSSVKNTIRTIVSDWTQRSWVNKIR
jgi:hypothetical protein